MKIPTIQLRIIIVVAVLSVSVSATISVWQLINQPWYGIKLEYNGPNSEQDGIRVLKVFSAGPSASKLLPGDVISAVISDGSEIKIPAYLRIDPNLVPTYKASAEFVQRNDDLYTAVTNNTVIFMVNHTERVTVTAMEQRPLYAVDWVIWFSLIASPICFMSGVICYVRKPKNLVTFLLFSLGLTTSVFMLSEVFLDREVFASADRILFGSTMRFISGTCYPFATIAVFFRWPHPILSKKMLVLFFFLTCLILINSFTELIALPFHEKMGHILVYYLLLILLFGIQWRRSKGDPVNRASLSLMLLSILIPVSVTVLAINIPLSMGAEPLLDIRAALMLNAPAIIIGWALAIFRYRLFNVEQWWFKSLLWMAGGLLVMLIDAAFVIFVHFSALQALPVALLIAGFLYFPLRQWLIALSIGSQGMQLQILLPDFIKNVTTAVNDSEYVQKFQQLLKNQFSPANIELTECRGPRVEIQETGLILMVPILNSTKSLVLSGKNNAASLFNKRDQALLSSLTEIGDMANTAKKTRESAIYEERSRIMQDLHDTLGARLLTLIHRFDTSAEAESAREALQILRETVRYSHSSESIHLDELLAELRAETSERIHHGPAKLNWIRTPENTQIVLEPLLALVIANVVREGVSNAIKYQSGDTIWMEIKSSKKQLCLSIRNEVEELDTGIKKGTGLNGLQSRIRKQDGVITTQVEMNDNSKTFFKLNVFLPLSP